MEKKELRKKYLTIRKNISDKSVKSKLIISQLIEEKEYQDAVVIALYKNLEYEVETSELIDDSIRRGKIVVLPRVKGENLQFYKINSVDRPFIKSQFGVEEPKDNRENLIKREEIDLMIVPGVCFDMQKNRLGFGKGYYDRFLAGTNIQTIGICFEEQVLKDGLLPVEETDIPMQKIITEASIIY